jgi:predicted DCC family thiol-disulfide oxidoreductase YuxK
VAGSPTLLFDGTCNFCNGTVRFLVDRDRGELRFAALQSDYAGELLARIVGEEAAQRLRAGATGAGDPDSMVFVDEGRAYLGA